MDKTLKRLDKKHLDFTKSEFEANGHKYIIESLLSFDRFKEFEKLEIHVGFGTTFQKIYDADRRMWDHVQNGQLGDYAVILHNRMYGVKEKLEDRIHPVFLLCALFINRDDEDRKVYNPNLMEEKIKDWQKEGFASQDFFTLAANLVKGFINAYKETLDGTLSEAAKASKK